MYLPDSRIERIRELQLIMKSDDEFEDQSIAHIKSRADAYVLLRYVFIIWASRLSLSISRFSLDGLFGICGRFFVI